jgi:hypothetical protein
MSHGNRLHVSQSSTISFAIPDRAGIAKSAIAMVACRTMRETHSIPLQAAVVTASSKNAANFGAFGDPVKPAIGGVIEANPKWMLPMDPH